MFEDLINKALINAWQKRQAYVEKEQIRAFRLITREEWRLPLAIDIYDVSEEGSEHFRRQAVIYWYAERAQKKINLDFLQDQLRQLLHVEQFWIKERFRKVQEFKATRGEAEGKFTGFTEEYGAKFWLNLEDYLDTGIFLDHRMTRQMIKREAAQKRLLNLFAYTGAFSVHAALGGARMTYSVDLSKRYCDWTRKNLELNALPADQHWVIKMDTFEFFKYAKRKQLQFDLIVIDPPTFSKNKSINFSVQRDHQRLLQEAGELLAEGGKILFSNNCITFQMADSLFEQFIITDLQSLTIPLDFRIENFERDLIEHDYVPQNQIHNCYLLEKII